jgi:hypothetical protein
MTEEEILNIINEKRNGTIELVKTKDFGKGIIKETSMSVELGVEYKTLVEAKEYEAKEHHHLPWGHWLEGYENLIIEHKDSYYLRVSNAKTTGSRYMIDGVETDPETAEKLIAPSKLKSSESVVFNIKFENIKQIN